MSIAQNDQERQLVEWLADMNEDDAVPLATRMLLEEGAEIFAKPELMIHADDVHCAHGNTAGGLDANSLFYLRSRGIGEGEARALLIEAFLAEAAPDWMPLDVREDVLGRIRNWLGAAP